MKDELHIGDIVRFIDDRNKRRIGRVIYIYIRKGISQIVIKGDVGSYVRTLKELVLLTQGSRN